MDFSSFVTSLITAFVIFVVLVILFAWLSRRPGNKVIYYPNRLLRGMDPFDGGNHASRNPFAWIREALSSSEQDVITVSGVDAAVYFVFLSTGRASNGTFSHLEKLSMGNVADKSSRLWAFLVTTYWVSIVAYYLLWKAYKHVSELRAAALMSPEVRAEQFAVLVRDIPPVPEDQTRKEQIDSYFKSIYPDTFYRSMVVTNNKEVNKIYEELEGYKKKLVRAETIYAESKKTSKPEGVRPTNKTGFLGLIGEKVDSIEYYSEKISELTPKLEAEQKATLRDKQQAAALVFFTSRVTAASAAQSLHATMLDTWNVMDAPEPRQVIWTNLTIKLFERQTRQYIIYIIVALTIFFYMIPITFVSAFTTLENLKKYLSFLKPVYNIAAIRAVLEAYLPQIAFIVFLDLLPKLLLFLSKLEGIPSQSHIERAASVKFFYFTVVDGFIGVTVGGTFFATFKTIEKDPNSLLTILGATLPGNATFFLTFVALEFFVGYGLELSRIFPLIIFHLKRKYLCKTEAEVKEAWYPGDLGYATRVPEDMLVVTITLCYSVMAPLIIPFGVLYFGLGWLILRNQALKVYVPSYESYGRMWPHMHSRILAALVLYQLTMLAYFGAKKFYYAPFLVPLVISSLIFAYVCNKKFYRFFRCPALEVASHELKETLHMERIFRAYVPPCLCSEKVEDDRFEDALSHVSRAGPFA
ncbi:CSC1-like protein ERD4 isoform X2 [Eucalyptus grandis]|uniref:CSC1-like protein ERD4 isoform X2 n=1 Tax=Eucalyptus grandis TaxID=71139 RepID=UPI00192EC9B2|nr:CSC1-like protein ERD4 isoform X2 [Eucalyptus grandis]